MHIDNRLSLRGILLGSVLRLNVVDEGGYRTGEHWNSTWLYPEIFKPERLIVMKSRGVTLLPGQKRKAAYLAPLTVTGPRLKWMPLLISLKRFFRANLQPYRSNVCSTRRFTYCTHHH